MLMWSTVKMPGVSVTDDMDELKVKRDVNVFVSILKLSGLHLLTLIN